MNSGPITLAQMELCAPRRKAFPRRAPCALSVVSKEGTLGTNELHKYDFKADITFSDQLSTPCPIKNGLPVPTVFLIVIVS